MVPLKNLAIKKALENNWQEACDLNLQILKENPNDIDTLNRLAFSYLKLGKLVDAEKMYKKVISFDNTHPIAVKNLKKIEAMSKQKPGVTSHNSSDIRIDEIFIEEAGKTKIAELKNIADSKTLCTLQSGDQVYLLIKRSKIFVQDGEKRFIGMLPDTMSMRLIPFMQGGNEYQSFIKSVGEKDVTIFIKESKRSKKFVNQPSFTITTTGSKKSDYKY
jgi:tetratricopeptide (TPR) repeat protein